MFLQILKHIRYSDKGEPGFTLVEMLTTLAILAAVMGPASAAVITIFKLNAQNTDLNVHLRQVQNAGYWITQDVLMAQQVITDDPDTFLTLRWTDWDGNDCVVEYVFNGDSLWRYFNGSGPVTVATDIDPTRSQRNWDTENRQLTVTIGSLGNGRTQVQRMYVIKPRPMVGGG